jgi:hypothetical protein
MQLYAIVLYKNPIDLDVDLCGFPAAACMTSTSNFSGVNVGYKEPACSTTAMQNYQRSRRVMDTDREFRCLLTKATCMRNILNFAGGGNSLADST